MTSPGQNNPIYSLSDYELKFSPVPIRDKSLAFQLLFSVNSSHDFLPSIIQLLSIKKDFWDACTKVLMCRGCLGSEEKGREIMLMTTYLAWAFQRLFTGKKKKKTISITQSFDHIVRHLITCLLVGSLACYHFNKWLIALTSHWRELLALWIIISFIAHLKWPI